jgi:hypothetical protein
MKYSVLIPFFLLATIVVNAQGTNLPLGNEAYHILDRLEIKTGIPTPYHSSVKYITRGAATRYALQVDTAKVALSSKDRRDLYYIFKDNNEWLATSYFATTVGGKKENIESTPELSQIEASMENPRYTLSRKPVFKHFYQTPANLFELNKKYIHLRVNPILNFAVGTENDTEQPILTNRRGLEIRGGIDDRIFFYTNIHETQSRFPDYVINRIGQYRALPGQGFFKSYSSDLFNIQTGHDYLNSQGYLGFNISRHVGAQFGYGRNFIGNGYRSVLLSDFSNNYLYLKLNWKVWRLHFQNIFAELSVSSQKGVRDGTLIPKKYMAAHHLSFNITPNLNVGFFETVIFSRNNQFELQYLNPVILYRTIEQATGSADNVLIGLDAKWNFLKHFQLYGQLMMDEFVFSELITDNQGWWGNKYAIQAGLKYIDAFGIDHLDLQAEYNFARPYTYTHRDSSAHYSHFDQPLAHPLGANFNEVIVKLRYVPVHKLVFEGRFISANFGEDQNNSNWGSNIFLSHLIRERDYDNETTQGVATSTTLLGLDLSYQLRHNVFLDLQYLYRKKDSELPERDNTTSILQAGVRINVAKQRFDF